MTGEVTSVDGTVIAFDRSGTGPSVVLVSGAFMDRFHPTMAGVATGLARWFTVFNYDRRGRGDSGDTQPYAVAREIEDLAAVIAAAGESAMVFAGSSGAALALEAAILISSISKLALWEPPYHVDASAPYLPLDFAAQLIELVENDRRGDAVELFMTRAAQATTQSVAAMRAQPSWAGVEAVAHTLAYEAAVMGPGNALPTVRLVAVTQPTLVLTGGNSPGWMTNAGRALVATLPRAVHRVLEGQMHGVSAEALVPELLEFFIAA